MFLLNNTHDRKYSEVYPSIENVVFDISDRQLQRRTNRDWRQLSKDSVVCVVDSSRRVSAFYRIAEIRSESGTEGVQEVATGRIIANLVPPRPYSDVLNDYGVSHRYLPNHKFMPGFNVANLGSVLDGLPVRATDGVELSLGALKARYAGTAGSRPHAPPRGIPAGITREHILSAIAELNQGVSTDFGESIRYDLIQDGQRYAPKAVLGLAARHATKEGRGPYDFKGGESSQAFRILRKLGFTIKRKAVAAGNEQADWSDEEVRALVADYFGMITDELARKPYSKTSHRRLLQARLVRRSASSIEFKHRNVSAALLDLNLPYIHGYKPAWNYQALLVTVIQNHLESNAAVLAEMERLVTQSPAPRSFEASDFASARADVPASPPQSRANVRSGSRRARRIDFRALDDANRTLGSDGERFVMGYERNRLREVGRCDLADRVRWTAADDGDGLGYDIISFDPDGAEIFIEVKTTNQGALFPFLISANEVTVSQEKGSSYRLYRVFEFATRPKFYEIRGPIKAGCNLRPTMYEARPSRTVETDGQGQGTDTGA